MKKITIFIILTLLFVVLTRCTHSSTKKSHQAVHIETVQAGSLTTQLFYSGVIQPLKTKVITSPVDGVIAEMKFHFGDPVKKGQLLYAISSEKFKTDYKTTLMQYIKSKNELNTARDQLVQSEFLFKNELISADEHKLKKSAFYNAQLAFLQAQDALAILLKQLNVRGMRFYGLSIEDIEKIDSALHIQDNAQQLYVIAPASGIALLPGKAENSDKKIEKGDQVKQGDTLALLGNLNSIAIDVNVGEFDINQLKVGQPVTVTGAAFPEWILNGKVTAIEHQARSGVGGLPTFSVQVVVPELSAAEQAAIHVGMSAKVAINILQTAQITLPLTAIFEKNREPFVKVRDAKTEVVRDVPVKTGQTTAHSVVILSSLKPGDQVIVPD